MHEFCLHGILCKIRFTPLAVRIWVHLQSLESTQEPRVALDGTWSNFPCPSITWNTLAKHKPILYRQLRRTENRQTCCTIRVSLVNLCTIKLYLTSFFIQFNWKLIFKVGSSILRTTLSVFFSCKPRRVTTLREEYFLCFWFWCLFS